ncbi:MAG: hypothetical protein AB3N17_11605 [Tateyamaria sp.]
MGSSTETIVGIGAGMLLKKLITGPAQMVIDYHSTHFKLLARAMKEAKRDAEISKSIKEMEANLRKLVNAGDALMANIPAKPEPPELKLENWGNKSKVKDFETACKMFAKGTKAVLTSLKTYMRDTDKCIKDSKKKIKEIEAQLLLTGSTFPTIRQIAIRKRADDLLLIQIDWMPLLKKQQSRAKKLHDAYNNI